MTAPTKCPHCGNADPRMIEAVTLKRRIIGHLCHVCARTWREREEHKR